jgi:hypothetical protein
MKVHNVRQVYADLKPYDYCAKDGDFMSVTEWHNGEGFDVEINSSGRRDLFQLTYGEFNALQVLVNYKE